MIPAQLIQKRLQDWKEFEEILGELEHSRDKNKNPEELFRFARLYRAICTDLSLARTWRLPTPIQEYVEQLVNRGHAVLYNYPTRTFQKIRSFFLRDIPGLVYRDRYVRLSVFLFYACFAVSGILSYASRDYAVGVLGEATIESFEEMHSQGSRSGDLSINQASAATAFYIANNVSIDLLTFGLGVLGGVGALYYLVLNGIYLGSILGVLFNSPSYEMILSWIPGHAPFELTAIGISAGAGLRIGFAMINPRGRERLRAFREEAVRSAPIISAAALLTLIAAFIEAFVAPLNLPVSYKFGVGGACLLFLIGYFIVLGSGIREEKQ